MLYVLVAVASGLVLGVARGGRPRHVARRQFNAWLLLPAGVALQVLPELVAARFGFGLLVASYVCLTLFAVRNLHLVGMAVVLVGLFLNLVPIVANEGMPVRAAAIVDAGIATWDEVPNLSFDNKHHLETPDDEWMLLADIIPVRPFREVLSFGDLVMAFGVASVLVHLMQPPRSDLRGRRRARRSPRRRRTEGPETDPEVIDLAAAERAEISERLRAL